MPVLVAWESDARKIIHLTIEGQWNWAEFYRAANTVIQMMESVRTRVDFILEARTDDVPDEAIRQIEAASGFLLHPQAGRAVMVGGRGYLRNLVSAFSHLYPRAALRLSAADTVDEARALLAEPRVDAQSKAVYMDLRLN